MSTPLFRAFDLESRGNPIACELLWKPPSRLKDPVKIAEAKADFFADAALSPLTGSIVIIGLIDQDGEIVLLEGTEADIIGDFWVHFVTAQPDVRWCFWSGCGNPGRNFDLDFIVTRSRILGIKVPAIVRSGRYYGNRFVDLASEFLLYQSDAYLSLTNAAELLGVFDGPLWVGGPNAARKDKSDPVIGATFAANYDNEATRFLALQYLINDLYLSFGVAQSIL